MEFIDKINTVLLYFYIPGKSLKKVLVSKNSSIGCLITLTKEDSKDYIFIYKGAIVDSNSTFESIGMKNENILVAIKKKNNQINDFYYNVNLCKKLNDISNDPDFEKKLTVVNNKNLRNEKTRIADVRYMKIEGSCRLYKKKTFKFLARLHEDEKSCDRFELNLNYKPLENPCEDAMPVLW